MEFVSKAYVALKIAPAMVYAFPAVRIRHVDQIVHSQYVLPVELIHSVFKIKLVHNKNVIQRDAISLLVQNLHKLVTFVIKVA